MASDKAGILAAAIRSAVAMAVMAVAPAALGDWTRPGGDAGMTKYAADDIPGAVQLGYVKRFYSTFNNDPSPGNYYYSSSIVLRNGTAAVFSADQAPTIPGDNYGLGIPLTLFNVNTGATTARTTTPSISAWSNLPLPSGYTYASGRYSFHLGEVSNEIDSQHYSASMLWGDDGRLYARHGGDNAVTAAYTPSTNTWTRLTMLKGSPNTPNYNNLFEGDANAFLNAYQGQLLYRPGDTRQSSPYVSTDISAAAWSAGTAGNFKYDIGPTIGASPAGDYYSGLRYGDIPKATSAVINGVSTPVAIVTGLVASSATTFSAQVQATNLNTGQTLWTNTYVSDNGGFNGFYTGTSDYWRYVASDDGTYVMYSGTTQTGRTLRGIDAGTGAVKWAYALPAGSTEPLLATHGSDLYVVGGTSQVKMNVDTGKVAWTASNAFAGGEGGYLLSGEDPIYRPMVLTEGTEWFIDGSFASSKAVLVGLRTSDGSIVQQIDLSALVAQKPGETLMAVNDLAESNGKLAVLLSIRSSTDPYPTSAPGSSNAIRYQDVYVFSAVPEPTGLAAVGLVIGGMAMRRRRPTARRGIEQ